MCELHFGYASFVYLVSKRQYSFQPHARDEITQEYNRVTFWIKGQGSPHEYDPYQIKYKSESDCGCVVINAVVLNERFINDNTRLLNILNEKSKRKKRLIENVRGYIEVDIPHCNKSGCETTIHSGDIVRCAKIKD
jgi:hypothetical protein